MQAVCASDQGRPSHAVVADAAAARGRHRLGVTLVRVQKLAQALNRDVRIRARAVAATVATMSYNDAKVFVAAAAAAAAAAATRPW